MILLFNLQLGLVSVKSRYLILNIPKPSANQVYDKPIAFGTYFTHSKVGVN